MNSAFGFLWNNRTMFMCVAQLMAANLATADLVTGTPLKWVLYINGTLTGLIALHNKIKEVRAEKASADAGQPE